MEFNFDLKNTAVWNSVKWGSFFVFKFAKAFRILFSVLFCIFFLIFLFGFFSDLLSINTLSFLFSFSLIFLVFILALWWKELFFITKLRNPKLKVSLKEAGLNPQDFNLAEFLSYDSALAVRRAVNFTRSKGFNQVTSSVLFYKLIEKNKEFTFVFNRILVDIRNVRKLLKEYLQDSIKKEKAPGGQGIIYTGDFQETIKEALKAALIKGHSRIEAGDLLVGLSKQDPIFKKILVSANLKTADIENLTWWLESIKERIAERKRFWERKNLIKKGSLAKAWSSGYTVTLDRFGIDYSEVVQKSGFPEEIGHLKEIKAVERILAGTGFNNCLLIGEPGVGKKSMILGLAQRSVLGESLPEVNFKRVIQLNLPFLAAQTETVAEAETILDDIFKEAVTAGNIILVIDEFHNFIGGKERPGVIDISGIIGPYLNLPQFQIVGITTFAGLHKYIEQNPSLLSLFEKVEVDEMPAKETLMILENMVFGFERKYKKFISFPALREIVSLADKYFPIPFPKSAMDLLDEVMVYVSSLPDKIILPKHVANVVSGKTEIPVGEVEDKERVVLLNLENLLHERIINQEEAVREVSTALRRARAQVTIRKGPMGAFLFLGPTGVGKTETAKALAQVYFGSEERMIRLDMSEFQAAADIPRLLGSPGEEGLLTTQIRENPFSLLLLDEIEKAHPNILNLFLQVLDEGFVTDGLGRKVDFKNCIIIATSNAGYQIILKAIEEKKEWIGVKREMLDYLFEEGIFRPEFINRFDAMVVFHPLSKDNLLGIAELLLQKLKRNLEEKNIEFVITIPLKEKIVELGYNPMFGAREMRRVIQDNVENVFASAILSGELDRGDRVEIDPVNFTLKIF